MGIAELIAIDNAGAHRNGDPNAVVKSAGRALQILEFFDGVQREACVSEISRSLRYPQSSTSALLRSLVSMGYLQHDRFKRTYLPTRRVSLLGNWVDPSLLQHGSLLAMAEALAGSARQNVVMATANGLYAQYIYIHRSTPSVDQPEALAIGALRPIADTAVGRALLSTYDDSHAAKILRRINAERPAEENSINVHGFLAALKIDGKHGYFTGRGAEVGQSGLAMTIDRSRELLVIAIEGDSEVISEQVEPLSLMLRDAVVHSSSTMMMMSA